MEDIQHTYQITFKSGLMEEVESTTHKTEKGYHVFDHNKFKMKNVKKVTLITFKPFAIDPPQEP